MRLSPARSRGQSVVEFALALPVMLMLLLGVIDFARIYTTMLSVESAAREAADFGTTLGAEKWQVGSPMDATVAEMRKRACVAASNLTDYAGSAADCTNPGFSYCVTASVGGTCGPINPADGCDNPTRPSPCTVTVTLTYQFHLIAPVNVEIMGIRIGFPSTLTFQRDSTFAMTDIDVSPATAAP